MDQRNADYAGLVALRKQCKLCDLTNPAAVEKGKFDSDVIGPYTRWHGDLNARLVVVAKDFAPESIFTEYEGRPGADVETNKRLIRYLRIAGFDAGDPRQSYRDRGLFFTNAILCLAKGEKMRTAVSLQHARRCGDKFLCKLLRLISPAVVVALGNHAVDAVLEACDTTRNPAAPIMARGKTGFALPDGPRFFSVPHPVASVKTAKQEQAWGRVRDWLSACRPAA